MRSLMFTLSSALALSACAGGVSGSFRGNGGNAGPPVATSAVKVVASKADMTGAFTCPASPTATTCSRSSGARARSMFSASQGSQGASPAAGLLPSGASEDGGL